MFDNDNVKTEVKPRIHVTTISGNDIYGSLFIGRLTRTTHFSESGVPIYKMRDGTFVVCSDEMLQRINERLDILGF